MALGDEGCDVGGRFLFLLPEAEEEEEQVSCELVEGTFLGLPGFRFWGISESGGSSSSESGSMGAGFFLGLPRFLGDEEVEEQVVVVVAVVGLLGDLFLGRSKVSSD